MSEPIEDTTHDDPAEHVAPRVEVPQTLPRSHAPGAPVINATRQAVLKLTRPQLHALATEIQSVVDVLSHRIDRLDEHQALETAERERTQRDIQSLAHRLDALEHTLNSLQLGPRLARLERRSTPLSAPPNATPAVLAPAGQIPAGDFDYLAFEARFRGDEETIRARQAIYLELLRDRRRVVDLGCGRGELLELLREAGISAYGVEMEPDFVALLREKELEVIEGDLFAHLATLGPGTVDAIVLSHVIEHFPPGLMTRFIQSAHDALAAGGVLIVETPNPESLIAGSVNFLRDPTHVRAVHPDTLAFVAESAGFASVEVQRLSPVPADERFALVAAEDAVTGVNEVIERLNAIVFGFQDYVVIARRS
jgi:SAM-dependent methyltransferase